MVTADSKVVGSNNPASAEVDFGVQGQRTHRSAHIPYFWETEKEFVAAVGFLEAGLRESDYCVIFGHEEANQAVCRVLEEHGYDLQSLSTAGRVSIIGGDPSGQTLLENIGAAFQRALDQGAPVIRLLGNIGWGKSNWPQEHDLLAFEAKVTEAAQQVPCVIVCMYDLHSLSGRVVQHGGFETHPHVMMGPSSIRQNSYYVPTDLFRERIEVIAAEIAERKRRDEALKKSEERFRTLFESAPLGISVNDAEGRFIHVNPNFQEMFGYSVTELTQLTFKDVTFGDDLAESKELFGELVEGKRQAFQVEKRYVRKDGSVLWAGTRCSAVRDANGNFAYTFAMVADISERKRASEALQKSEERLRMLLEISNAIITKNT